MIEQITIHKRSTLEEYRFSVLIPTWNNVAYLKLCITSLIKHSSLRIQIIVFVNEGNDGTVDWLEEQDDIDYLNSKKNIGICYSLNLARTLVKSDYIIYLNDDMYALPNWDTELDKEILNIPTKAFMLSSTMIEPVDIGSPCIIVKDYGNSIENFDEKRLLNEYQKLRVENWSGSTWPPHVVHKDIWDLIGGLSIEFSPGMYSDPDFSRKLYDSGCRIFKGVGTSLVYHFGSKSTKKLKKSRKRNEGRLLFLFKWGITSNVFCTKILKRGKPYKPIQKQPKIKWDRFISKLKMLSALLTLR